MSHGDGRRRTMDGQHHPLPPLPPPLLPQQAAIPMKRRAQRRWNVIWALSIFFVIILFISTTTDTPPFRRGGFYFQKTVPKQTATPKDDNPLFDVDIFFILEMYLVVYKIILILYDIHWSLVKWLIVMY